MKNMIAKQIRKSIIHVKLGKARRALKESQDQIYKIKGDVLEYNIAMASKRKEMQGVMTDLTGQIHAYGSKNEQMIYLTLIYFSAIGTHMVKKADVWLKNWSVGFAQMGHQSIADAYRGHAQEEVGHDKWHRQDVRTLVKMYNEKFNANLSADEIISSAVNAKCVVDYELLSEQVITKDKAHLSLAELYETEIMAMELAPKFIGYCVGEAGFEILKGLKFLSGHVVADVEHIADNVVQMDTYLKTDQKCLNDLVNIGGQTVDIYTDYFTTAVRLAQGVLDTTKVA